MALGCTEYRTTYLPKTMSRMDSGIDVSSTGVPISGKSVSNSTLPTSSIPILAAAVGS